MYLGDIPEEKKAYYSSAKSRRCYHRVISGIERGGVLRFLTLTSSNESPDTCQKSFRALYMRLKRRNLIQGYIKVPELSKNGKQHLHILFRGSYIEQALISTWWQELHHAKIVDIRKAWQKKGKKALASYLAKYMSKENAFRYSWNWGWVWRGFVKSWLRLKKEFKAEYGDITTANLHLLTEAWRLWLQGKWLPYWSEEGQPP